MTACGQREDFMNLNSKSSKGRTAETGYDYKFRYTAIKTLAIFKQSIEDQDRQMAELIEAARGLNRSEEEERYNALRKRLRLCIFNKKLLEEMSERLELSLQLDTMDRMIGSYNGCMELMKEGATDRARGIKDGGKGDIDRAISDSAGLYRELTRTPRGDADRELEKIISDERLDRILESGERGDELDGMIEERLRAIKQKMEEI